MPKPVRRQKEICTCQTCLPLIRSTYRYYFWDNQTEAPHSRPRTYGSCVSSQAIFAAPMPPGAETRRSSRSTGPSALNYMGMRLPLADMKSITLTPGPESEEVLEPCRGNLTRLEADEQGSGNDAQHLPAVRWQLQCTS